MQGKSIRTTLALLAVTAMVVPASARPISKGVTLSRPATIGGKQLSAGDYKILVDGTNVTIEQNHKAVAEVEGRWESRDRKYDETAIVIGSAGQIKEIRFAGDNRALVLGGQ